MEKGTVANGSALGGGALGTVLAFATGCIGIKLLVFLGISSGALSGVAALEPYRPLLLVVGGLAFAVGLWRILRRRKAAEPVRA